MERPLSPIETIRQSWMIHPDWDPVMHRSFLINDADWRFAWDDDDIPSDAEIADLIKGWNTEAFYA